MITGDLSTMPLADLLQWADSSRISARLLVEQEASSIEVHLADHHLIGISSAADLLQAREITNPHAHATLPPEGQRLERFFDAFLEVEGRFTLHPEDQAPLGEGATPVHLPLMWVAMDGMRIRDEWPRISAAFPNLAARIELTGADPPPRLALAAHAVLALAAEHPTVGESVYVLGLSRPALLRQLDVLLSWGLIEVDGAVRGDDPVSRVLRQVTVLAREDQFDEATHVIDAMLAADPHEPRLRDTRASILEMQRSELYARLGGSTVFTRAARPSAAMLPVETHVLELCDGTSSVDSILARSALRDVHTLKCLARLAEKRLISSRT